MLCLSFVVQLWATLHVRAFCPQQCAQQVFLPDSRAAALEHCTNTFGVPFNILANTLSFFESAAVLFGAMQYGLGNRVVLSCSLAMSVCCVFA
jgi:hypothetical protein